MTLYDTSNNDMATNLHRSTPQPTDSSPNTIHDYLFHFFGQVEEPHPRSAPSLVMNQYTSTKETPLLPRFLDARSFFLDLVFQTATPPFKEDFMRRLWDWVSFVPLSHMLIN